MLRMESYILGRPEHQGEEFAEVDPPFPCNLAGSEVLKKAKELEVKGGPDPAFVGAEITQGRVR
jgi:hypothetical protein